MSDRTLLNLSDFFLIIIIVGFSEKKKDRLKAFLK